jgi:GH24 family phage-related lysozyme (muramidase)
MANQPNAAQQQYRWETSGNVLQAVVHAKGVRAKTKAYMRASWNAKTQSPFTDNTTGVARLLRLMNSNKAASIWDALFLKNPDKQKPVREIQERPPTNRGADRGADRKIAAITLGALRAIRIDAAYTRSAVDDLSNTVDDLADNVKDIKSLIMPKKIMARGQAFTDEWGRENSKQSGKIQLAHYNPLAPAESQFLKSKSVTPKGWRKGLTVHGGPTSTPIERGFMESAIRQAAIQTAILTLKIEKKDREKAELKKKHVYKDPKESDPRVKNDPILAFFTKIDKRLNKIEEMLEDGVGGSGSLLDAAAAGAAGGLGVGAAAAIAAAIGSNLLPFLLGLLPMAFMYKFTKWAEEADINNPGNNPIALMGYFGKQGADWYNDKTGNTKKWKDREAKNAAAGRTRGGIASAKGPSIDESIAIYDARANNPKSTEKERSAAARVRDTFIDQKLERAVGKPMSKPVAPTEVETMPEEIMFDSDTWDENYQQQQPQTITTKRVGRRSTGRLAHKKPTSSGEDDIKNQIKEHEGLRLEAYRDTAKERNWTIGYGHFLGKSVPEEYKNGITKEEADALFEEDYKIHREAASQIPGFDKLNRNGKRALINLTFNMGPEWWKGKMVGGKRKGEWKKFIKAMSQPVPDIEMAARSLESSAWHDQVKSRAPVVISDLRAGLAPDSHNGLTPVSRTAALEMDQDSRIVQTASTYGGGASQVTTVAPVVVNNNQQNTTMANRPLTPATSITKDPSLIRTALRDMMHPIFTGG